MSVVCQMGERYGISLVIRRYRIFLRSNKSRSIFTVRYDSHNATTFESIMSGVDQGLEIGSYNDIKTTGCATK